MPRLIQIFRLSVFILGLITLLSGLGCSAPDAPEAPAAPEPPPAPSAAGLEGAWQLQAYSAGGQEVPEAAGVMIFTRNRFGMIYAMGAGDRSARAHAGAYSTSGDVLTFNIPWWVENVEGEAQVMASEVEAKGRFEQSGDNLTIRFASGSVQELTKIAESADTPLTGAWILEAYQGGAKTGPSAGTMLFADGHFVLVYTMDPEEGLDGRGHGGSYRLADSTLTLGVDWDLHYVGGEVMFSEESYERETTAEVEGDQFTLTFSPGNFQRFRRAE